MAPFRGKGDQDDGSRSCCWCRNFGGLVSAIYPAAPIGDLSIGYTGDLAANGNLSIWFFALPQEKGERGKL